MQRINGTMIASYYACKRELWYMAHQITPDQDNPFLDLGRLVEEESYQEEKKKFLIGDVLIDIVRSEEGKLIVGEIKKSSRSKRSGIMQLYFYLWYLKERGVKARGEVLFPREKRKIPLVLNRAIEEELKRAMREIELIIA
ncbi:MAG: CRISPR-associated exonuclease Cas4, partial [Candidatus Atribacteria bacterium]|nr:CRISPR-associated exonuclease Cas4 [Candidatus Atribacteria bacterium]